MGEWASYQKGRSRRIWVTAVRSLHHPYIWFSRCESPSLAHPAVLAHSEKLSTLQSNGVIIQRAYDPRVCLLG